MPFISIVIPCRNEERFIRRCLESVLGGDYPSERLEVIVADGLSDDGTRKIVADLQILDPRLRMVDNPKRTTPAALNRGIEAAKGEIVIRMDAHARIAPDYARKCVATLASSGADNVGGIMHTVPAQDGIVARALAAAISHPFGVGNSRFRTHSSKPIWVDTVFGGCYRRDVFDRVGYFNEDLSRGQDMEFNLRLRRAGGKILLDPSIESWYYSRSDMSSFLAHNWTNGVWALMPFAWSEGAPVALRHLVPMGFAGVLLASLALSPAIFAGILGLYAAGAIFASLHCAIVRRDSSLVLTLPICFAALHLPYGFGSLWGALSVAVIKARGGELGKRLFDAAAAAAGLMALAPLLLLVSILTKAVDGGSILYRGVRVGRGSRRFDIYKFRTMVMNAESLGGTSTSDDDRRITRVGAVLRRWKLDELPQLWNVLAGDMSLVGPRPQVEHDVAKYTAEEKAILGVRPGITDWSSIKFRNEGEILKDQPDPDQAYIDLIRPEKIRLQLHYVRTRSFLTDLKILWATFLALAGREVKLP